MKPCVNADTINAFQAQLRHTPWAVCTPHIVVIRESGLTIIELELELKGLRLVAPTCCWSSLFHLLTTRVILKYAGEPAQGSGRAAINSVLIVVFFIQQLSVLPDKYIHYT